MRSINNNGGPTARLGRTDPLLFAAGELRGEREQQRRIETHQLDQSSSTRSSMRDRFQPSNLGTHAMSDPKPSVRNSPPCWMT